MLVLRPLGGFLLVVLPALACGCTSSRSQIAALESQNRTLAEQGKAQAARIENLEIHRRNIEDQLMRAEEDLALMEEQLGLERRQLANYEKQRDLVQNQVLGLVGRRAAMPAELSGRLARISRRYPSLKFDPHTGVSKLDTDILFDTGSAELKPGAEQLLVELAQVLNAPETRDLKILVAGHSDDRQVARKPARDQFDNNFDLSSERALAVASALRRLGVGEHRMAVAGFGGHQPVAPNLTPADRQKNRRVELFVMAPDAPVIGWSETTPSLY
ncbi:MAG: OmpA family protein [Pirellulales bacterium]|nr:OmpA family protein [Pirellulales bacterium]